MRQLIREYFSFTKNERIAIIGLLALVLLAYVLPYFIKPPGRAPSAQEVEEFRKLEQEINRAKDHEGGSKPSAHADAYPIAHGPPGPGSNEWDHGPGDNNLDGHDASRDGNRPPERLFYFDPNTVSEEGWKQLGLRSKTIGTILKYLSKGGRFYHPVDLKKIYGLRPAEYARLERYIRINRPGPANNSAWKVRPEEATGLTSGAGSHTPGNSQPATRYQPDGGAASATRPIGKYPSARQPVDINTSDTTAWIGLPGIGSKLAARIVSFREKLGGFYAIEQVGETYGLPDSTFRRLLPLLTNGNHAVKKINLNTASLETLKQHPYIRWNLASAIVRYRDQHGAFTSLETLLQIVAITPDAYKKVVPYLTLSPE